jgi:hypothetical protein
LLVTVLAELTAAVTIIDVIMIITVLWANCAEWRIGCAVADDATNPA